MFLEWSALYSKYDAAIILRHTTLSIRSFASGNTVKQLIRPDRQQDIAQDIKLTNSLSTDTVKSKLLTNVKYSRWLSAIIYSEQKIKKNERM